MPLRLAELAPMITDPAARRPVRQRASDIIMDHKRLDQQAEQERARMGLEQQRERRLGQQFQLAHGLDLGQLDLQRSQFEAGQRRQMQQDEDKLFADLVDAVVVTGDQDAIRIASENLRRKGYDVGLPEGASAPPATPRGDAASPAGQPKAPMTPAQKQLGSELDRMEAGILGSLSGPQAKASTARRTRELELSPGDSLLTPQPVTPGAQPGAPAAPQGPRPLTVRRNGQTLFTIDPGKIEAGRKQVIADTFEPLIASGNEIQTAAAKKARDSAMARLGTAPLKAIIADAVKMYENEVDQLMGVKRAQAANPRGPQMGPGDVGPGMTDDERARLGMINDDFKGIIAEVRLQTGTGRAFEEADSALNKMYGLLSAKGGLMDRAAISSFITGIYGKASSNRELGFLLESVGVMGTITNAYNHLAGGGQLNEELLGQLAQAAAIGKTETARRRQDAGEMAYNWIMGTTTPMTPEERQQQAELARGIFTRQYRKPAQKRGSTIAPAKQQAAPAPQAPAQPKPQGNAWDQKWGL